MERGGKADPRGAAGFRGEGARRPGARAANQLVALTPWIRAVGVSLAVIALARPQTRDARVRDLSVEGIDIVDLFDLSTSMEAGDFKPLNRIHVAKQVLTEFLSSRTNDRVGLVVFAGEAYTQAPLTLDYSALKEIVSQLRTRVLEDGTAIGDAGRAPRSTAFASSDAKSKVIVLITDGDNNAGKISPIDAATMARRCTFPFSTSSSERWPGTLSRGSKISSAKPCGATRTLPSTRTCSSRSPG